MVREMERLRRGESVERTYELVVPAAGWGRLFVWVPIETERPIEGGRWNIEDGGSRYPPSRCNSLGGLCTLMRLVRGALSSSSDAGSIGTAASRLRLPVLSLVSSKSSVLANQESGAVTMFLIAPKRVFVRESDWRLFVCLRLLRPPSEAVGDAINDDEQGDLEISEQSACGHAPGCCHDVTCL
jgi:hypothetical protein